MKKQKKIKLFTVLFFLISVTAFSLGNSTESIEDAGICQTASEQGVCKGNGALCKVGKKRPIISCEKSSSGPAIEISF